MATAFQLLSKLTSASENSLRMVAREPSHHYNANSPEINLLGVLVSQLTKLIDNLTSTSPICTRMRLQLTTGSGLPVSL